MIWGITMKNFCKISSRGEMLSALRLGLEHNGVFSYKFRFFFCIENNHPFSQQTSN